MSFKPLMILGTGSDVGKATHVAGLCRLFANQGIKVAPFKSQNMSLNRFTTLNGEEIAHSTAVQVLAKKWFKMWLQKIIFSFEWYQRKLKAIQHSLEILKQSYDLIIAEETGSGAEPNFRKNDLVNMEIAHLIDASLFGC